MHREGGIPVGNVFDSYQKSEDFGHRGRIDDRLRTFFGQNQSRIGIDYNGILTGKLGADLCGFICTGNRVDRIRNFFRRRNNRDVFCRRLFNYGDICLSTECQCNYGSGDDKQESGDRKNLDSAYSHTLFSSGYSSFPVLLNLILDLFQFAVGRGVI